jgi:hypothetical protein
VVAELEKNSSGDLDGLAGSRFAGAVEVVALDVGDFRDNTSSTADSRWNTGHGNECVRLIIRCRDGRNRARAEKGGGLVYDERQPA